MRQQGFRQEEPSRSKWHFRALLFQPAIVGPLIVVAIVLQSAALFVALAAVLLWNAAFPRLNPFERFYDFAIGRPKGMPAIEPAPGPRRFAQAMAAAFMIVIAVALSLDWKIVAYLFEAGLLVAFTALLGGRFCLGAYLFHLMRGRTDFANATCPWSRD